MAKQTIFRSMLDDDMGPTSNLQGLPRKIQAADTAHTVGSLIVRIEHVTDDHVAHVNFLSEPVSRHNPVLQEDLGGKMAFIYESKKNPGTPGWFVAIDEEICGYRALGNSLFTTEPAKALRSHLYQNGASECRWVDTQERLKRQPSTW